MPAAKKLMKIVICLKYIIDVYIVYICISCGGIRLETCDFKFNGLC